MAYLPTKGDEMQTATQSNIRRYKSWEFGTYVKALAWKPGIDISEIAKGHSYSQTVGTDHDSARIWGWHLHSRDVIVVWPDGHIGVMHPEQFYVLFSEAD